MKKHIMKSLFLYFLFIAQFSFGQLNIVPASAPNVCDGTAAFNNPSSIIQTSITWYGNGAIIATNTYQIGNLCQGNYTVSYVQSNPAGGLDSLSAFFIIGNGANPCSTLNATLTAVPSATQTSNNGELYSSVTGGNPPYMYMWSTAETTQNVANLMPGNTYCLFVNDMAGCSFQVCEFVDAVNSTMGDTLVLNNANCGPASTGLFTQELEDCNFDFNACNNAFMSTSMMINIDTLQTQWNFIDTNGVASYYTVNFNVPNALMYTCLNLQFTLFCSVKSLDVKTIVVNDAAQLSGVNEIVKNPFNVINPMGNELTVQFDEVTSGTIRLYNMNGQMVKTQSLFSVQQATIATTNLPTGTYFFQLEVGSTVYTQKVIK